MVVFSLVAAISGSIAWFNTRVYVNPDDNFHGKTEGFYFAYGSGTSTDPYGIAIPRHLYNLSWLQMLGYFNEDKIDNSTGEVKNDGDNIIDQQYYFELANDINMSGWAIPPIGTETNPFIGTFNGNGYTISNLTIANTYDAFNKTPTSINGDGDIQDLNNDKDIHIVGMFGVVGAYSGGAEYNSSINSISNFTLSNASITSQISDTLAGIVAGYVNGPLENVGVINSNIDLSDNATVNYADGLKDGESNSLFTNISDYSVVGYCESPYLDKVHKSVGDIKNITTSEESSFTVQEEGDDNATGGSIDMKTTYDGLRVVWDQYTDDEAYHYNSTKTVNYDYDGNQVGEPTYGGETLWTSGNYRYYPASQTNTNGDKTSQYTFAYRTNTNRYMYLYGKHTKVVSNGLRVTRNYYAEESDCFYIKSTDNSHYLAIINGAISNNITSSSEATVFKIDDNGRIYTVTGTSNPQTYYYLRYNNGVLGVISDVSYATSWGTNANHTYFYYANGNDIYYITYYNNSWTLRSATGTQTNKYIIYDGSSNYLCFNGTNFYNSTNAADATTWSRSGNSAGNYKFYTTSGNETYYIGVSGSSLIATNSGNARSWESNTRLYYYNYNGIFSRTYYYVTYSNGAWSFANNSSNYNNAAYYSQVSYYVPGSTTYNISTETATGFKQYVSEESFEDATFETQATYFPLKQETTNNSPNGIPRESNTGYIIGGANSSNELQGNIRVSQYFGPNIRSYSTGNGFRNNLLSASYSNGKVSLNSNQIYTINNSSSSSNLVKATTVYDSSANSMYAKTISKLENILSQDSAYYIYGLHFMDADIEYGNGNSVYAESATKTGYTYDNYELPTNCIDFNLKENGRINFVAGSYFVGNDSFFSLHDVQRDNNHVITNIRQIAAVWVPDEAHSSYSNIYEYKTYNNNDSDTTNDQYSVPFMYDYNGDKVLLDGVTPYADNMSSSSSPTTYSGGYTKKFECSWIEKQNYELEDNTFTDGTTQVTQGYAYYFEIPMNEGEYCLGSVNGGTGAYLMYLDIGANAEKITRNAVTEYMQIVDELFSMPKGVGIICSGLTVNNKNSYCVMIGNAYQGKLTVNRTSNSIGTIANTDNTHAVTLRYSGQTGDNDITIAGYTSQADKKVTTETKQLTYFEYHSNTNRTTKIVLSYVTTRTKLLGQAESSTTEQIDNRYIYNATTGQWVASDSSTVILYDSGGNTVKDAQYPSLFTSIDISGCTTTILNFKTIYDDKGYLVISAPLLPTISINASNVTYPNNPYTYGITIYYYSNDGTVYDLSATTTVSVVVNSDNSITYVFNINDTNNVTTSSNIRTTMTVAP